MIYILLLVGLLLILYGWKKRSEGISQNRMIFKEFIQEQDIDKREYIEILSLNHEIKSSLTLIDKKLESILGRICMEEQKEEKDQVVRNQRIENYDMAAERIEGMLKESKSVDEIAERLNMTKGEVLLLKRLLTK